MTKISNENAYPKVNQPTLDSILIGTDKSTTAKRTRNFALSDVLSLFVSGLSPETGGTLKTTLIEYSGVLENIEDVVNNFNPAVEVLSYENLFIKVNGTMFLYKKHDISVGFGETPVENVDFIEFPSNTGPTGNGIESIELLSTVGLVKTYRITYTDESTFDFEVSDGEDGTDATSNNLQRTVTSSFTLENSDNNYTIIINNGASDITVTIPSGLTSKIAVGFIQQGTGDVTFVESSTTINSPSSFTKIKGQNFWCYIEQVSNSNVYQLTGSLKA